MRRYAMYDHDCSKGSVGVLAQGPGAVQQELICLSAFPAFAGCFKNQCNST